VREQRAGPGERDGGRLLAGDQQRHELVAQRAPAHAGAGVVARA
jgi:hypothetical protein